MQRKIWKKLLLVALMAVLFVAVGITASAETWGDYEYVVLDDGTVEITKYIGDETEVEIPDEIDGKRVTTIGDNSFYGCTNLTDIVIPDGVTIVEEYAFRNCNGLTKITIPANVATFGRGVFFDCKNLKTVMFENGITNIGNAMFYNCYNLERVILPNSVVTIGEDAFNECRSLAEATIPDSVTTIGKCSFQYAGISNIDISKNVVNIGDGAFSCCYNLKKINVSPENVFYSSDINGVLFDKEKTELLQYPNGKTETFYVVPEGVKIIGEASFGAMFYLENVVLPHSLEIVEEMAFALSPSLTTIKFLSNIKKIDSYAFCYSMFMEKLYIESIDVSFGEDIPLTIGNLKIAVSREEFIEIGKRFVAAKDRETEDKIGDEINSTLIYTDDLLYATLYCHAGSTAEAYAIENGMDYVLTHFFEGEWTYDYDNMIRYRKCIHCDELETEALETTNSGDVEIIEPVDPDTDFVVDVVTDYVIIEEALSNGIAGDFEIVKAFDITMTGKDGVHVQPNGTVKVKLPNDWSKNGVYKVYRVNDDGTLTDMNAYRQGSHMVFETDHFSIYVIVDESEKADEPAVPDEPQEETKDNFITRLIDLIKAFFDLIASWFK